ncbi:MAG: hypothetical protein NTY47_06085, partial [Candidatus Omnitrophica bacterium]|nr:hypothetical protein [Candidatus Omnitrophota bacterium]
MIHSIRAAVSGKKFDNDIVLISRRSVGTERKGISNPEEVARIDDAANLLDHIFAIAMQPEVTYKDGAESWHADNRVMTFMPPGRERDKIEKELEGGLEVRYRSELEFYQMYDDLFNGRTEEFEYLDKEDNQRKVQQALGEIVDQLGGLTDEYLKFIMKTEKANLHILDGGLKGSYAVLIKYILIKKYMQQKKVSLARAVKALKRVRPHILFKGGRDVPGFNDADWIDFERSVYEPEENSDAYHILENIPQLFEVIEEQGKTLPERIRYTKPADRLMAIFYTLVLSAVTKEELSAKGKRAASLETNADLMGRLYDAANPDRLVTAIRVVESGAPNTITLKGVRPDDQLFDLVDKNGKSLGAISSGAALSSDENKTFVNKIREARIKAEADGVVFTADEIKIIEGIISTIQASEIIMLNDNEHGIVGVPDFYGGRKRIFINKGLLKSPRAFIGLFHEAGEVFLARNSSLIPNTQVTSIHQYLRGSAERASGDFTYGLQDKLFNPSENDLFTNDISGIVSNMTANTMQAGAVDIAKVDELAERISKQQSISADDYQEINRVIVKSFVNIFRTENIKGNLNEDTWKAYQSYKGVDAYEDDAHKLKWDETKVIQGTLALFKAADKVHQKSLSLFVENLKATGRMGLLLRLAKETHNAFYRNELADNEKRNLIVELDFLTSSQAAEFLITGNNAQGKPTVGEQFANRRNNPKWKDKLTLNDVRAGKRAD